MKPTAWLWLLPLAGLLVLVRLPRPAPVAHSEDMSTLTKAKKSAVKRPPAKPAALRRIAGLSPRRTPPAAVGTVGDILKMGADFGKGADWNVIETAHESRDS